MGSSDAALLAAAPRLKICANMAVGYNNFDVDAMTAAGVQGTNTPDVLNEEVARSEEHTSELQSPI